MGVAFVSTEVCNAQLRPLQSGSCKFAGLREIHVRVQVPLYSPEVKASSNPGMEVRAASTSRSTDCCRDFAHLLLVMLLMIMFPA